jgi:hypothetical protein
MDFHSARDWWTLVAVSVSSGAIGALLSRRSFGSYAGRIVEPYVRQTRESNEGVRNAMEMTRQSDNRVIARINEHAAEEQEVLKASQELLSEVVKVRNEMKCRVTHHPTDTERIA